jgi:perosamine synthetase
MNSIPHSKPTLGIEEENACKEILRSGNLSTGEQVKIFESDFSSFMGIPSENCIAVSSGTAALYLSLMAFNPINKFISFPAYVCSSLSHATRLSHGKEILIDNSKDSPNVDLKKLKATTPDISIIPYMYGNPIDISEYSNNIIEDCCQSLGAKIKGTLTGLLGDIGIFSFYATKIITTGGQGGMIVSKNNETIKKIRNFLDYDQKLDQYSKFNFTLTDLQASVGIQQLKKLPTFLKRREFIFNKYDEALPMFKNLDNNIDPIYYRALLKCKNPKKVVEKLNLKNIHAVLPMENWIDENKFPNAYDFCSNHVSLPIYPSLTDDDVERIISVTRQIQLE